MKAQAPGTPGMRNANKEGSKKRAKNTRGGKKPRRHKR